MHTGQGDCVCACVCVTARFLLDGRPSNRWTDRALLGYGHRLKCVCCRMTLIIPGWTSLHTDNYSAQRNNTPCSTLCSELKWGPRSTKLIVQFRSLSCLPYMCSLLIHQGRERESTWVGRQQRWSTHRNEIEYKDERGSDGRGRGRGLGLNRVGIKIHAVLFLTSFLISESKK